MGVTVERPDAGRRRRRIRLTALLAMVAIPLLWAIDSSLVQSGGAHAQDNKKQTGGGGDKDKQYDEDAKACLDDPDGKIKKRDREEQVKATGLTLEGKLELKDGKLIAKDLTLEGKVKAPSGQSQDSEDTRPVPTTKCQKLADKCTDSKEEHGCLLKDAKCIIECATRLMVEAQQATAGKQRSVVADDGVRSRTSDGVKAQAPQTGRTKQERTDAGNRKAMQRFDEFLAGKLLRDKGITDY